MTGEHSGFSLDVTGPGIGEFLRSATRLRRSCCILDQRHSKRELSLMFITVEQITHEALTLPETERAHLAQTLLQSLDSAEEGVEQAWATEVSSRVERVHEGTAQGRPADEVFGDIRARHQK